MTTNLLTPGMLNFLKCQSAYCKESTLGAYKAGLKHFARFMNERALSLDEISDQTPSDFLCALNAQKLAPYTKLNYFIIVRKYLVWEISYNRVPEQILKSLDTAPLPKVPEYLPRPLSAETDCEFERRCRSTNSPYALLFLLLRQTGLRISELINLPWNPTVTVGNAAFLKVPLGKMNSERMVPLHADSIALVHEIKAAYPIRLYACDKNRLIGFQGSISSVRQHLDLHFKKITAGLDDQNKHITFHRLRHTYATSLLSAGVSIVSIMKLLGHRRIEMSLRYAKVTPTHLRNEYLKAISVIENQAGLQTETQTHYAAYKPTEIVACLRAYAYKSAEIPTPQKKNLLQMLTRLKRAFSKISFRQNFTMPSAPSA